MLDQSQMQRVYPTSRAGGCTRTTTGNYQKAHEPDWIDIHHAITCLPESIDGAIGADDITIRRGGLFVFLFS